MILFEASGPPRRADRRQYRLHRLRTEATSDNDPIARMEAHLSYDALTIDTQTVYANDRKLDRGLIAQLAQYRDGLVQFVLSEVVARELRSMLVAKARAPLDALNKALRDGADNGQFTGADKEKLGAVVASAKTAEEHARKQLQDFISVTGAEIVRAEDASIRDLLNAYFHRKPPFSIQGKKSEFPDAISLLALEAWAAESDKKILAVSKDSDWKAYAAQSEWIDCVEDLADAMAKLASLAASCEPAARRLLQDIRDNPSGEIAVFLQTELEGAVERETPSVEIESSLSAEEDGVYLALQHFEIEDLKSGTPEITIVRVRNDGFVMRVPVTLIVHATVDVAFSVYDSVDKEDLSLGSTQVEREITIEAFALIDCREEQDPSDLTKKKLRIEEAELVEMPRSIDIGYVDYATPEDDDSSFAS